MKNEVLIPLFPKSDFDKLIFERKHNQELVKHNIGMKAVIDDLTQERNKLKKEINMLKQEIIAVKKATFLELKELPEYKHMKEQNKHFRQKIKEQRKAISDLITKNISLKPKGW